MNQMGDRDKDKEQLLNELMKLRTKIAELENVKANHKQAKKELAKSEELYRLIAESTSDVISLTTFNLHPVYTYVSSSVKVSTGYEPEELLGKSPFEFIHLDDKKKLFPMLKNYVSAKIKKLLTGKELPTTKRIEFRFKDKEGNWRYLQSVVNIVGNKLLFITRDITESKQTEEALHKSQKEFASLFKHSPEALVYTDEKSDILDINPRFTELFGYTLEEIKGRNIDDGMIHSSDRIEEGKELGRIAKSKGYFKYETIRKKKDGTLFPVSIYGSNISIDGQLKGMLVIYIDTTERKNMLDKLKKSEEKYRHLFENMPGAYYRTDREGNLIMINPEGAKLFGYNSLEGILGKNIAQHLYFAPEERKRYLKELEKNKGNLKDFELTLKKKDGTLLVISDTSHFYYDKEGNIAGVEGIFMDITERKKNREELRESQQEFASLFKSNPEALVYLDKKGIILDANLRFCKLFGYTLKEIKGRNIDDGMIHTSDKIEEGKKLSVKGLKGYFNYETIRKKKDGTLFPVSISATPLEIDGQAKGEIGIYIDITKRKNMLDKLKESEEKYRSLFENIQDVYFRADTEGNIIIINPAGAKLFGYDSVEDILGKNLAKDLYLNPEERKKNLKKIEEGGGYIKDHEVALRKKDGTPLTVTTTSHFFYDKEGKIAGVEGLLVDITERKQNEKIQKVLYNISQTANSPISLVQLYKTIHKELGNLIDTTNFYIALVDEKEDKLFFPFHVDESSNNTPTTHVIKTGQPFFVNRKQLNGMVAQETLAPQGTITDKSVWLGVPLKIEDRVIGAMVVQSYTNPDLYSKKDIKLLEFVSSQVATVIERKSSEERIKHLSFHDALTGLYNRAYFEEELERYNFPRYYPLSIVMIDINGLKVINDTFGHQEGDRLLQHLSQVLVSVSRQGDILARIGGDEFAIILPSTSKDQAYNFCQRIKKACQQDKIKPIYLRLNISLGHATQEGEYKDINSLFKVADRNMYQDKLFNSKSREKHFLEAFRIILAERDPHTEDHAQRLQELALSLGRRVGLTEYQLGNLKLLALLHDIGKIGIPDSITLA
jgi:diguanylate cyclase (GGDEF)-like protein/PAS domain S-box-containing protein